MSAVGIEMTINPPTEGTNKKWWYRSTFITLGLAFVGLSIWQSDRLERKEAIASSQHQAEQVRNEGNLKFVQGQLDSINKVLGNMSNSNNPQQTAAMLKELLPHIDTSAKSALEKMRPKDLRSKVIEFANQMREWSSRHSQREMNASLALQAEIFAIPKENESQRQQVWNKSVQQMEQRNEQFKLEFKEQYLGTAISYKDELLRRLGPQQPETGIHQPLALDEWIVPASVEATATYLEKLARKL